MSQQPPASAWYKGDPSIVSYGYTIADDLCLDHLSQLKHLDDGHEEEAEGDSSSICTDCAISNSKELEVDPDFICQDCEPQPSAWCRGDPSIVSHGDAIADALFSDHASQLETSAEFLWDGSHDFSPYEEEVEVDTGFIYEDCGLHNNTELVVEPCFAMEEVEACDATEYGVNPDAESYYSLCFADEEFEVECSDAATDCNSEVEEDWDCYSN